MWNKEMVKIKMIYPVVDKICSPLSAIIIDISYYCKIHLRNDFGNKLHAFSKISLLETIMH